MILRTVKDVSVFIYLFIKTGVACLGVTPVFQQGPIKADKNNKI